jgi:hypothetical protein
MNSATKKGRVNQNNSRIKSHLMESVNDLSSLSLIMHKIDAIPCILNEVNEIRECMENIQKENLRMRELVIKGDDYWMDAEDARVYMRVSKNTFDNYRYSFNPRLIGHPVGGKTLYKKSDIDHWVRTYQYKSADLSL